MNCPNCGMDLIDNARYCQNCGYSFATAQTNSQNFQNKSYVDDEKSIGCNIISFFFPIVGLILWLVWRDEYPIKAKGCGKSALISVIVSIILYVFMFIATIALAAIGSGQIIDASYEVANSTLACYAAMLPPLF